MMRSLCRLASGRFLSGRRAAVSILFAASAVPMLGLVGLAVDFAIWNQTNSALSVAANVAAMSAVKIAANAQLAGDPAFLTEGRNAGIQWFAAESGLSAKGITKVGTTGVTLDNNNQASVTVTYANGAVNALVSYQGTLPSIFGAILFHITNYHINGEAQATISSTPYLNVEILLDNSGSMEIGATNADITALQEYTPCASGAPVVGKQPNAPGAFYNGSTNNLAGQQYSNYVTSGYDGLIPTPAAADPALVLAPFVNGYKAYTVGATGVSCLGVQPPYNLLSYPTAGPPCAFACHFDGSGAPAGTGNDYYAIARRFAGLPNQINLRFDLVKNATNQVIAAMNQDNIPTLSNLNVGVFTFNNNLNRVYPLPGCGSGPACEAGNAWATAIAQVGAPPNTPYGPDTGIQPLYIASNNGTGNSDFHVTMTSLAALMTASGDGTQPTTPRKVLFLVTDGLVDYSGPNGRVTDGVQSADCNLFKSLGFTVYVVYTPYYPVMNQYYMGYVKPVAEPMDSGTLATDLKACATSPSDFISASDATDLGLALQTFLKAALSSPARFTI